jgi:predicted nucleic-acid-binding protein
LSLLIAAAVEGLLAGNDRIVEHHDAVRASLEDYKQGRLDFTDALIGQVNRARGCEATATFDRKASKLDGFIAVS